MTRNIEATRIARAKMPERIVEAMENIDELDGLIGSDEAEIGFSGRYGCFRLGYGGQRILLDDIGG